MRLHLLMADIFGDMRLTVRLLKTPTSSRLRLKKHILLRDHQAKAVGLG